MNSHDILLLLASTNLSHNGDRLWVKFPSMLRDLSKAWGGFGADFGKGFGGFLKKSDLLSKRSLLD